MTGGMWVTAAYPQTEAVVIGVARRRSVPPRKIGQLPAGVKTNVWLATGTPFGKPYPCRCSRTRQCKTTGAVPWQCPDVGRSDTEHLPAWCCARRDVETTTLAVAGFGDDEGSDE